MCLKQLQARKSEKQKKNTLDKGLAIDHNLDSTHFSGLYRGLAITLGVFVFLLSISMMGTSIGAISGESSSMIFGAIENPFIGLFIGLLSTALLQSSSTVTSILVAAVAAQAINISDAIPIVMGANIGTTLTSTIVSMGYITKTKEFKKAVSAGTIHDFFNIIMVMLLFPLEMKYQLLERGSTYLSSLIGVEISIEQSYYYSLPMVFKSINMWILQHTSAVITLLLAIILLFVCIKILSKLLYNILIGKTKKKFETTIFSNTTRSFGWGLLITSVVQSSSLTTSLIVPLVATGKVKLKRAFQFILGANIGTTITALIAALFQSEAAVSIALVHFLFNTIGVSFFLLVPFLFKLPIFIARKMGMYTLKMRIVGFAYILLMFFLIPFTLISFSKGVDKSPETLEIPSEH